MSTVAPTTDIQLVSNAPHRHRTEMEDSEQPLAPAGTRSGGDVPQIVAIEAERQHLDIHKPKQVHSWREFLSEIGTIVVGVLIALAAEQAVESLHHRTQVAELSEALNQELSYNLAVLKDTVDLQPCLDRRLAEIARWSVSASSGPAVQQVGEFGRLPGQIFHTAIWRAASGSSVDLLPLNKRISYAHFYDGFGNVDRIRDDVREKWSDIANLEGADALTKREALRITHDIRDIRTSSELLKANFQSVRRQIATELRIAPGENGMTPTIRTFLHKRRAEFCKSLTGESPSG